VEGWRHGGLSLKSILDGGEAGATLQSSSAANAGTASISGAATAERKDEAMEAVPMETDTAKTIEEADIDNDELFVHTVDEKQFIGPLSVLCEALFGQAVSSSNAAKALHLEHRIWFDIEKQRVAPTDSHSSRSTRVFISGAGLCRLVQSQCKQLTSETEKLLFDALGGREQQSLINTDRRRVFILQSPNLLHVCEMLISRMDRQSRDAAVLTEAASTLRALRPRDMNAAGVQDAVADVAHGLGAALRAPLAGFAQSTRRMNKTGESASRIRV
jgi:hypothetical protein